MRDEPKTTEMQKCLTSLGEVHIHWIYCGSGIDKPECRVPAAFLDLFVDADSGHVMGIREPKSVEL
jgi:hypothetical protein|tara:strand:- start:138 stop:335 length:198 start_codon:yes stop_codon:yes gene_type:complete